jgi:PadR family transcriptional regulator AphA
MKTRTATEYVILGALMLGSRHGYEMMQFLASALEATWRVSTSQLYLLLKRLEKEKCLDSSLESQETRPSKRVYALTPAGRKAFEDWLRAPVVHVRQLRAEFLSKLFFFHRLSLSGADGLVEAQIEVLEKLKLTLEEKRKNESDRFMKLVYGFKVQTVGSTLSWLLRDGRSFVGEERDDRAKREPKRKGREVFSTRRK